MPWFPDFVAAAEMARRETRAAGQADPVAQYLRALTEGSTRALETTWPGHVVILDPYAGEVHGHRHLRDFVRNSQAFLAEHLVDVERVASTSGDGRAVVEVLAQLKVDGEPVTWPVAVVAESADDLSVTFRTYGSQWPVVGRRPIRPPILGPDPTAKPGDVVGRYLAALAAGDTDAVVRTFSPDGSLREPIGPNAFHQGPDELRARFSTWFAGGGIGLEPCRMTDDGTRSALEYNVVRWGDAPLTPQAGIAVFERGPDELLTAVRRYDDVEGPGGH